VLGLVTFTIALAPEAQKTEPGGYCGVAASTVLVSVHDCPPIFNAKLAVPLPPGVPVMVYVKEPAPVANDPATKVAVKPVTPVEVTVCPLCVPPFPPVYGTLLLTPEAAIPAVSVPLWVADAQLREEILPEGFASLMQRTEFPKAR
jgi:hypothetical protein